MVATIEDLLLGFNRGRGLPPWARVYKEPHKPTIQAHDSRRKRVNRGYQLVGDWFGYR